MFKPIAKTIIATVLTVSAPLIAPNPVIAPNPNTAVPVIAPYAGAVYSDIAGTWFEKEAVNYGYADIFSDGSGKFNPETAITRMEFARLLHRALDIEINYFAPIDISEHFTDVKNEDVGASELYDLVTAGIIEPGSTFEPGKALSREDMVILSLKALDSMTGGNYAIIKIMPPPFVDDAEIDETHKWDIYKAVILGLVKGHEDYSLRPKDTANRAEAVTVVSRLTEIVDRFTRRVEVSASMTEEDGALRMTLTVENRTKNTVTIQHMSGQKFDFKLFDAKGENLYTWSADKLFTMALTTTEIAPGQSETFEAVLESEQYAAIKDRLASMKAFIAGTSEDFFIDADGYVAFLG